jgi:ferredoxin
MIFYFSGTGNSLYVAQAICNALDEPMHALADSLKEKQLSFELADGERIGFIFPVYFYTVPTLVVDFINNLRVTGTEKPYVFAVMTCGGQTGQAGRDLDRLLFRQRLDLAYQAAVVLPDNFIPLLTVPDTRRQQVLFDAAEQDLAEIIRQLQENESGDFNRKKGPVPSLFTTFAAPLYRRGHKTRKFFATDACNHCRLCADICPENAIDMQDGKPVWVKDRCTYCLACLHRCPVQAIQHGRTTRGKRRYVNPNIEWPQKVVNT